MNHGGGFALFRKLQNTVQLRDFSKKIIYVKVQLPGFPPWRLTCFYGFPERNRRKDSWQLLKWLKGCSSLPWCCIGDFNNFLAQSEKRGGSRYLHGLIYGFREAICFGSLREVMMKGYPYTWECSRGTPTWTEEELDRTLASDDWHSLFLGSYVLNEDPSPSDDSTLLLCTTQRVAPRRCRFHFENAWSGAADGRHAVMQNWNQVHTRNIQDRINACATKLDEWRQVHRNQFRSRLSEYRGRNSVLNSSG